MCILISVHSYRLVCFYKWWPSGKVHCLLIARFEFIVTLRHVVWLLLLLLLLFSSSPIITHHCQLSVIIISIVLSASYHHQSPAISIVAMVINAISSTGCLSFFTRLLLFLIYWSTDYQKLEREARICRMLKHPTIGEYWPTASLW